MNGYSHNAINKNASILIANGMPRNHAIAEAMNIARLCYFKQYPHGALPEYLAFPKHQRLKQHYDEWGKPRNSAYRKNPAKRHAIVNATTVSCYGKRKRVIECAVVENEKIIDLTHQPNMITAKTYLREKGISDIRGARRKNPAPSIAAAKAAQLYTDFTGHTDLKTQKINVPAFPKAVTCFGFLDAVSYSTVRDGNAEKYIHRFRKDSRPLLCASPDGKQLFMLGGAYDFTERGIVDKKPRSRK